MLVDPKLYRKAFLAYLRKGTPVEWSLKQNRPTEYYVWRARDDEKVRPSHGANNGLIFAWDNPPQTGHPGVDFGCRCIAEPYQLEDEEFITIDMTNVSDMESAWTSRDFVQRYFHGSGRGVTVRETGHLREVVDAYTRLATRSLQANIARLARENHNGAFSDNFYNTYDMQGIVFSLGDTTIGGNFVGRSSRVANFLSVAGEIAFYLQDEFVDPLDVGVEVVDLGETLAENLQRPFEDYLRGRAGLPPRRPQRLGIQTGEPYPISDEWSGAFQGQIYLDPFDSSFR